MEDGSLFNPLTDVGDAKVRDRAAACSLIVISVDER